MPKPEYRTEEDERTFNLVDQHTVDRLRSKGDVDLPPKKVSVPDDKKWNTKTFNSVLLQSINEGSNMKTTAARLFPEIMSKSDLEGKSEKEIAGIIKKNQESAMRNARTMMTYAENAGRLDSYKELQAQGIVMKKQWMATPDDRTRESHIDIDGEEVDPDDKFSNGCECPGDPGGPPEEVWNCRCSMVGRIVGFKAKDGSVVEVGAPDRTMHEEQMEAEKERRAEEEKEKPKRERKEKAAEEKPAEQKEGYADRIKAIRERIGEDRPTEADVKEAGEIMAEEVNKTIEDMKPLRAQEHEIIKEDLALSREFRDNVTAIREDPMYKEAKRISQGFQTIDGSGWYPYGPAKYFKSEEEALAFLRQQEAKITELADAFQYKKEELLARREIIQAQIEKLMEGRDLASLLSEVRPVGLGDIDLKDIGFFKKGSKTTSKEAIAEALTKYPTEWVSTITQHQIYANKTSRGYCMWYGREISISGQTPEKRLSTAIHELGHATEYVIPGIADAEKGFYERRTAGEPLKWLGPGYGRDEKARKDDFFSPYIGKDYGDKTYEVCSMGFDAAYTDPEKLAGDPDMQSFILGVLCLY